MEKFNLKLCFNKNIVGVYMGLYRDYDSLIFTVIFLRGECQWICSV